MVTRRQLASSPPRVRHTSIRTKDMSFVGDLKGR
jgi:hypothetical protein